MTMEEEHVKSMQIEVGNILDGKVTGITNFGAFVELPEGKSGMVHISEISNTYVENVSDFLTVGQEIKVKVININENGKIGLSIKKLAPAPAPSAGKNNERRAQGSREKRQGQGKREDRPMRNNSQPSMKSANAPGDFVWQKTTGPASFEDMMTKFKQTSDEKISSLKKNGDVPVRRPRRK